jgi:hypothetical protein
MLAISNACHFSASSAELTHDLWYQHISRANTMAGIPRLDGDSMATPMPTAIYDSLQEADEAYVKHAFVSQFGPKRQDTQRRGGKKDAPIVKRTWTCDRAGWPDHRNKRSGVASTRARNAKSKKTGCPFRIDARRLEDGSERWEVTTLEGECQACLQTSADGGSIPQPRKGCSRIHRQVPITRAQQHGQGEDCQPVKSWTLAHEHYPDAPPGARPLDRLHHTQGRFESAAEK